ncbi:MAG: hypothetical protein AAF363_13505 [Bacteroidota bacterium]
MKYLIITGFLIFSYVTGFSQENGEIQEQVKSNEPFSLIVDYDTPLTIDLETEDEEEVVDPKKKKRKKRVFYGLKTKKGFTRNVRGNNVYIELFHYLKTPVQLDPYVRDIYWFNYKKRQIEKSRRVDSKYGVVLHGPYKRVLGEEILEEGIYYKGMKHGRWVQYEKFYDYFALKDKEKYYKGWPKESKVSYYSKKDKDLKEIIPIEYGEKEGYYYKFHENGQIAAWGEFKFDSKVGVWNEYYDDRKRRRRKRQIQYSDDPFDEDFRPYIIKEWSRGGKVLYDRSSDFKGS